MSDFNSYIRNNRAFIPNFEERYRHGETISTAFVEPTINQVVSRRFVKKQQMHSTLRGAPQVLSRSAAGVLVAVCAAALVSWPGGARRERSVAPAVR